MNIEEELSKFTHEVEETFHEVKDHVILAVERHSLLIALVLMSVTTAVLVIGTVYVWCFHHPSSQERSRSGKKGTKKKRSSENGPKESNDIQGQTNEGKDVADRDVSDEKLDDTEVLNEDISESRPVEAVEEKEEVVRKRIPSGSGSLNNNESPVKSKIPVRRSTSKTKQS